VLRLDGNHIKSLDGLKALPELNELSLARNQLSSLEGLAKFCPQLEILDVAENRLSSVKRLVSALTPLEELVELRLENNPLVEGNPTNYRQRICGGLPSLQFLDTTAVVPAERAAAAAEDQAVAAAGEGEFDPAAPDAEMQAYMKRMKIGPSINSHLGRPTSARCAYLLGSHCISMTTYPKRHASIRFGSSSSKPDPTSTSSRTIHNVS
jgi:hypothetical protein